MDRSSSAEGFLSPPSVGQPEDDSVEDGESDSEGEDADEEEKKSSRGLSLGTPDEYVHCANNPIHHRYSTPHSLTAI